MINNMAEHSSGFEAVNIDKMQGTVINESVEEFLKMIEDDERDAIREVLQEILEQSFDRFKVAIYDSQQTSWNELQSAFNEMEKEKQELASEKHAAEYAKNEVEQKLARKDDKMKDLERQLQESKLARNQPKLADDNDMKLLKKRNEELADEINKKNEEYKKLEQSYKQLKKELSGQIAGDGALEKARRNAENKLEELQHVLETLKTGRDDHMAQRCRNAEERAKIAELALLRLKQDLELRTLKRALYDANRNRTNVNLLQDKLFSLHQKLDPAKMRELTRSLFVYEQEWEKISSYLQQEIDRIHYEFESCMSMLEAGAKLQDLAQIHISSPPPGPAPPKNLVDMIQMFGNSGTHDPPSFESNGTPVPPAAPAVSTVSIGQDTVNRLVMTGTPITQSHVNSGPHPFVQHLFHSVSGGSSVTSAPNFVEAPAEFVSNNNLRSAGHGLAAVGGSMQPPSLGRETTSPPPGIRVGRGIGRSRLPAYISYPQPILEPPLAISSPPESRSSSTAAGDILQQESARNYQIETALNRNGTSARPGTGEGQAKGQQKLAIIVGALKNLFPRLSEEQIKEAIREYKAETGSLVGKTFNDIKDGARIILLERVKSALDDPLINCGTESENASLDGFSSHGSMTEDERCVICMDALHSKICTRLDCDHFIHEECYAMWATKNQMACPLCRHFSAPRRDYPPLK